jgi:hypothetical protein
MARLRHAVVNRYVLMGMPRYAVSNERSVACGGDALATFVYDGDYVITALNTWPGSASSKPMQEGDMGGLEEARGVLD